MPLPWASLTPTLENGLKAALSIPVQLQFAGWVFMLPWKPTCRLHKQTMQHPAPLALMPLVW